jgi:hypothetical protein
LSRFFCKIIGAPLSTFHARFVTLSLSKSPFKSGRRPRQSNDVCHLIESLLGINTEKACRGLKLNKAYEKTKNPFRVQNSERVNIFYQRN